MNPRAIGRFVASMLFIVGTVGLIGAFFYGAAANPYTTIFILLLMVPYAALHFRRGYEEGSA